eukprot:6474855-Ditylum_brightwellii.AAC.1
MSTLNIKRAATKRSGQAFHEHAHYVAMQKKLFWHDAVNCRKQLEAEEMDLQSPINRLWRYYIISKGLDNKAGIRASHLECPVAATAHNKTKAIAADGVEVIAADHNWSCFTIITSLTNRFSIGEDPSDSLFSGGPDETGQILRKSCIKMLVKVGELSNTVLNVDFDELTEEQQKVVHSAMPLKFIYEVDGGGVHNNMHLQNMLAYIAGHFEMGIDKTVILDGCPGH